MGVGSVFPEGQWCAQQDATGQIGRKDLGRRRKGPPLLEYLLCFESRAVQSDIPADPEIYGPAWEGKQTQTKFLRQRCNILGNPRESWRSMILLPGKG